MQMQVKVKHGSTITIIALYILHEYGVNAIVDELDNFLTDIKDANLIFTGDVNLDLAKQSNPLNNYLIKMASHGL